MVVLIAIIVIPASQLLAWFSNHNFAPIESSFADDVIDTIMEEIEQFSEEDFEHFMALYILFNNLPEISRFQN